jgi:hypothetical protein
VRTGACSQTRGKYYCRIPLAHGPKCLAFVRGFRRLTPGFPVGPSLAYSEISGLLVNESSLPLVASLVEIVPVDAPGLSRSLFGSVLVLESETSGLFFSSAEVRWDGEGHCCLIMCRIGRAFARLSRQEWSERCVLLAQSRQLAVAPLR